MHLAVLAMSVLAALPVAPVRLTPEVFPALEVALTFNQIAGSFPTLGGIVDGRPRGTGQFPQPMQARLQV